MHNAYFFVFLQPKYELRHRKRYSEVAITSRMGTTMGCAAYMAACSDCGLAIMASSRS